jgi:hypothetical protein
MKLLRQRIHNLIEQLADDDLEQVWKVIHDLHCDFYMMKAIQQVKHSQQPWDTLTHEQVVRGM